MDPWSTSKTKLLHALREREREKENPRSKERTCVRVNDDIVDRSGGE
jgi:hypothetical protein